VHAPGQAPRGDGAASQSLHSTRTPERSAPTFGSDRAEPRQPATTSKLVPSNKGKDASMADGSTDDASPSARAENSDEFFHGVP
jgi:hypothetical protein